MSERVGRVGRVGHGHGVPDAGEGDPDWRGARRRGRGLTGPLAVAISGLVLYLAWCALWERSHPASPAARGVKSGDAAVRLQAMRDLERLGPQDPDVALPALIEGLADPDAANRAAAITGLVAVIHGVAGSPADPGQVGDAVAALLGRLKDPDASVRARSAQALWTIVLIWQGAPRVIDLEAIGAAMNATADDPDAQVRSAALRGLGVIGQRLSDDPPARLVAALEDPSREVRASAAQSLAIFHRGLARALPALVKAMESTRPECRPAYLSLLKEVRPTMIGGPLPADMIPALASALGSRDREVRHQVARLLGEFGAQAREAIPALVSLLGEPDPPRPAQPLALPAEWNPLTRSWAAGEQDLGVVATRVLALVAGDKADPGERPASKDRLRARAAVAALGRLLRSPEPRRRAAAAIALRSFAPDAALIPALSEAVTDRDASVRAAALWLLDDYAGKLKFPAPRATLEALEDRSPGVRLAAATALKHIQAGVDPMVPALILHAGYDPDLRVRAACTSALRALEPPAVTVAVLPLYIEAIESLESPSPLRSNLILALPRFGPAARAAVPALLRLLQRDRDRRSAPDVPWLAEFIRKVAPGTPEAGQALAILRESLDAESNLRQMPAVIDTVARFGPEAAAALPRLRELGKSADPHVSVAARKAIAAIEVPGRSAKVVGSSPGRHPADPSPPG